MQRAQCEAVVDYGRPLGFVPLDVRRLNGERRVAEATRELADGAPASIRREYLRAEPGIPSASSYHGPVVDVPDLRSKGIIGRHHRRRFEYGIVQGGGEVVGHEIFRDPKRQLAVSLECRVVRFRQAAANLVALEVALVRTAASVPPHQRWPIQFPNAVALHAPKRIFGVDRLAVRAEPAQQLRKLLIDKRVGRQAWCAPQAATYGPQGEQGLCGARASPLFQSLSAWNRPKRSLVTDSQTCRWDAIVTVRRGALATPRPNRSTRASR